VFDFFVSFLIIITGKSTTLKSTYTPNHLHPFHNLTDTSHPDFQLTYARNAWQEERTSWRAVIQLNLLRSIILILDLLSRELSGASSPGVPVLSLPLPDEDDPDLQVEQQQMVQNLPRLNFTEKHKLLRLRLAPLRRVLKDLEMRIGAGSEEPTSSGAPTVAAPFDDIYTNINGSSNAPVVAPRPRPPQEFYVRSSTGWKSALEKIKPRNSTSSRDGNGMKERWEREAEEATQVISGCREDMKMLWEDEVVRRMLERKRVRLEESGGL
jgi:guanine nucleotide-binding protein subunit alpha